MEDLSKERNIYLEIQEKLFYVIPEKWDSIYLYASVVDESKNGLTSGEMYFYYFPKSIIKTKAVNGYEIPSSFNIDEDVYSKIITDLYNLIKLLRVVWFEKTKKKWSNITITIVNNQFKIEYDYEDLKKSMFSSYERHLFWRYLYLKPDLNLLPKKDKKIIQNYMEFITTHSLPKKDLYLEGIYTKPVKNITDFEKTLSVEEAIARSEQQTKVKEQKKRMSFFKKRKSVHDIIEMDDEMAFNNQILNCKMNNEKN